MPNRRDKRFARRLQVRFWKRGEKIAHSAYTTNVSTTGMFIATSVPPPPGSRVRVELLHGDEGFMLEGEVVHAARVSPLLKQLRDSGMGVRFLTVPELIAEILPAAAAPREEAVEKEAPEREGAPADADDDGPWDGPDDRPAGRPPLKMQEGRVLPLAFESLPHFLQVLQRDIASGGIFVPNVRGLAVDERVRVELRLPPPVSRTVRLAGRVVHVVGSGEGENLLAGVGVQLSEPELAARQLERMIYAD